MHIHSNPGQRCNAGAPMGRMRSQPISSSILGTGANGYGCPLVISVGIDFGKRDPLNTILKLLEKKRIHDPEALRERYELPAEPCICAEWREPKPLRLAAATVDELLVQVLLLGLCTAQYFDPQRPLLLTRASLTRRLQLYAGRGFYA